MHVVVAGSRGLLGTALVERLTRHGHRVERLVRGAPSSPADIGWDPGAGVLDPGALRGVDAVVNLGGAGPADRRWNAEYKRTFLRSRTEPTALLSRTIATLDDGPRTLLQASAVGIYGDRGDEVLTEASPLGEGFLAEVATSWEAATAPAERAGIRVAHLRTGIVMSRRGGSFGRLLPLLRLGLGGPLGPGTNYWGWITLPDHVRAMEHLLTADVSGAVHLTGPEPAPQEEVVRAVAAELHRPSLLRVPRMALRVALGEFVDEVVLGSQRAVPTVLASSGFTHSHPDLRAAAQWVAGTTP